MYYRTEEEDFVFGPAQLLPLPAALQWEVGDAVQVRVDHEEFTQYHQHHQHHQQHQQHQQHQDVTSSSVGNGAKGGNGEEGEGWVEGTVWAVHADQRYTVKINATGQVRGILFCFVRYVLGSVRSFWLYILMLRVLRSGIQIMKESKFNFSLL